MKLVMNFETEQLKSEVHRAIIDPKNKLSVLAQRAAGFASNVSENTLNAELAKIRSNPVNGDLDEKHLKRAAVYSLLYTAMSGGKVTQLCDFSGLYKATTDEEPVPALLMNFVMTMIATAGQASGSEASILLKKFDVDFETFKQFIFHISQSIRPS